MAYFKHDKYFIRDNHSAFDQVLNPGTLTPFTGIYRCEVCGHEAGSTKQHPLPPEHHAANAPHQRTKWRLIVAAHPI
jgi:hypothetical protein